MADSIAAAAQGFDAAAFRNALREINAEKAKASEYVSAAGAATKNAVDRLNLNTTALTITARLARKEPDEQANVAEAMIRYFHAAGFFDQDSFDGGSIEVMRQIVADADAGTAGRDSAVVKRVRERAGAPAH